MLTANLDKSKADTDHIINNEKEKIEPIPARFQNKKSGITTIYH
jgi:hypothetical protein